VIFFNAAGLGVVDLSYGILYLQEDGTRILVDSSPISYTTILPTGETLIEYPNELTPSTFTWGVEFPFVSDGTNRVLSLLQSNSSSGDELSVSGTYVTPQGNQEAVLIFSAETQAYIGLLASDGTTVYQASPSPGDQFIVNLVSISPDGEVISQPLTDFPLTFGLEPFTFSYSPAPSGTYDIVLNMTDLAGNSVRQQTQLSIDNEGIDGTVRGYTDTNEGVYFQYPYAWGQSYTFTNDDGSLTSSLSDDAGAQAIYIDVYLETDAITALESVLSTIDGDVSELVETSLGGLTAYAATYTTTSEGEDFSSVVFSVDNEPAASVIIITFTGIGAGIEPDADVVNLVDQTLQFFPPLLD